MCQFKFQQKQPHNNIKNYLNGKRMGAKGKRIRKNHRSMPNNVSTQRKCGPWNSFENITYARILLRYLIHGVTIDKYFLEILANLLNKLEHQVYTYHCRMLSEYGKPQTIVMNFLKFSVKQHSIRNGSAQSVNLCNLSIQNQSNKNQVQEIPELYFSENEVRYISNMFMIQRSPDSYEQDLYDCSGDIYDLQEQIYMICPQVSRGGQNKGMERFCL